MSASSLSFGVLFAAFPTVLVACFSRLSFADEAVVIAGGAPSGDGFGFNYKGMGHGLYTIARQEGPAALFKVRPPELPKQRTSSYKTPRLIMLTWCSG